MPDQRLAEFAGLLGHDFERPALLREALTHPSTGGSARRGGRQVGNYDRLEFVGDRVLGLVIASHLFDRYRDADAGQLARRYNALVRRETLTEVAAQIGLGEFLILSRSERESGGAEKPTILANACEAMIGALFIDGGFDVARQFVLCHWSAMAEDPSGAPKDAKTALQEWAHKHQADSPPQYVIVAEEGPPHQPMFTVELRLVGRAPTRGQASSKRAAEQHAAQAMLDTLR